MYNKQVSMQDLIDFNSSTRSLNDMNEANGYGVPFPCIFLIIELAASHSKDFAYITSYW